jgi:hypothetical protein
MLERRYDLPVSDISTPFTPELELVLIFEILAGLRILREYWTFQLFGVDGTDIMYTQKEAVFERLVNWAKR